MELLVGSHPEGVQGAGDHRHLGTLLVPVDGVRGDGGDPSLVRLDVRHPVVVNTLEVIDSPELNPNLNKNYSSKMSYSHFFTWSAMVFPNSSRTGWITGSSLNERGCWNGQEVRQRPASEASRR